MFASVMRSALQKMVSHHFTDQQVVITCHGDEDCKTANNHDVNKHPICLDEQH